MPNRIIKESICTSDSVDKLSWFEEAFFYRLIVNCDDFGRADARLAILKSRLFPLKSVTEKQIGDVLSKLVKVGIVFIYDYDGKQYLQLLSWEKHQNVRTKRSKYPPFDVLTVQDLLRKCKHLHTDDYRCNANPIQSNPNPIQSESELLPEAETASDSTNKTSFIEIILNDGTLYPIYQEQASKWESLYPNVDVYQELRNMVAWADANPKKRKTTSGILRFATNWLKSEQDSGSKPRFTQNKNKQVSDNEHYETDSSFVGG